MSEASRKITAIYYLNDGEIDKGNDGEMILRSGMPQAAAAARGGCMMR